MMKNQPVTARVRTPIAAAACAVLGFTCAILAASPLALAAAPPTVAPWNSTPDGPQQMLVRGFVNPHGSEITDCHFEYGTSEGYGQSAACTPASPGIDEVQEVTIGATKGEFRLAFEGESTGVTFTADIQAGSKTLKNVQVLSGHLSLGIEASGPGIPDGAQVNQIFQGAKEVVLTKDPTASSTGTSVTADIPYNAPAVTVHDALAVLSSVGDGNIAVTGGPGDAVGATPYRLIFQNALGDTDIGQIVVSDGAIPLSGGSGASIATVPPLIVNEAVPVAAQLTGLTSGTRYHFRLSASNGSGTTLDEDGSFETLAEEAPPSCSNSGALGAGLLPDCRAWELVSPPVRDGSEIIPVNQGRFRAAADGDAATFASLQAFGDVAGTGVASEYMAIRSGDPTPGNNGWTTHGITPPQESLSVKLAGFAESRLVGELSPDLDRGIYNSWTPLTKDPYVANTANIYLRDDLRTPGSAISQLLSPCPRCETIGAPLPALEESRNVYNVRGASADFGHILFDTEVRLTAEGATTAYRSRAYEWTNGQLHLMQVPPGSEVSCGGEAVACVAAPFSHATVPRSGAYPTLAANAMSSDGTRVFFTVPTDASGTPVNTPYEGRIYVRIDQTTTDLVDASERTSTPDSYHRARFLGASADGSRVFFSTAQALTDDAQVSEPEKLYAYDTTKPASDPHNLTLIDADGEPADGAGVEALIGTSDDGSYAYFVDSGQLVSGATVTGRGIYVWHEGSLAYLGHLDSSNEVSQLDALANEGAQARLTPDGRHLLFQSASTGLGAGFQPGECGATQCTQLYLYSADTGTLTCASCPPAGAVGSDKAEIEPSTEGTGAAKFGSHLSRATSDNGRYSFFTSWAPLVARDTNGAADAYEYDARTGEVHLLTSGTDPSNSFLLETDPSGANAFVSTHERLSNWDSEPTSIDIYDARIGGGFPEAPPRPAACSGDSCRPASSPVPTSLTPAQVSGPGNPPIRRGGKKHRPKKHHGQRHHKRPSGRNGGRAQR